MPLQSGQSEMYEVLRLIEQANLLAAHLPVPGLIVFDVISLETPRLQPAELGCIRLVSWLFVQHFEAGRIGASFLETKAPAYDCDSKGLLKTHRQLVQRLRTFFQHNLSSVKPHDKGIQEGCRTWFREKCGTAIPADDAHWNSCLKALLTEAVESIQILTCVLRHIEADEYANDVCQEWTLRAKRAIAPHQFDELIALAVADLGRSEMDPVLLRKRHYDAWSKHLSLLVGDADILTEARKLVEDAVMTAVPVLLPITGKDIIEVLRVAPGPRVGKLLEHARQLINTERLTRDEMLERLKAKLDTVEHPDLI